MLVSNKDRNGAVPEVFLYMESRVWQGAAAGTVKEKC
jgi:hypothetical protein